MHRELKRKHVTLQILWEEYIAQHPQGYRYSRFCDLFRRWEGRLPLVMRQSHAGGEKLFVDYAGDTVPVVINRRTGEIREAHLFVAVLGGSSLSFACATWTEQFADWAEAHNAAFAFFGGVPQLLVPDNAKVAVIKACHFDPMVNRSYTDLARHYGTAVLPTRSRKPRDKAKVEACVGIVERWVLGRLRNRIFYSLAEVNAGIAECLADLNDRRVLRQFWTRVAELSVEDVHEIYSLRTVLETFAFEQVWARRDDRFRAELRRRNVIRMAGLYLVGAWLVIQIAETLLPIFHTPDWVLQALVVLLALIMNALPP